MFKILDCSCGRSWLFYLQGVDMLLEIQKHINQAIEMVCKENLWNLITDAYVPSSNQIIVHYATKSILLLQIWKHINFLWVSHMSQAYTFPHCLWVQFLMELNNLLLISEAAGPTLRSSLWICKERKDLAPRISERQFGIMVKAQSLVPA